MRSRVCDGLTIGDWRKDPHLQPGAHNKGPSPVACVVDPPLSIQPGVVFVEFIRKILETSRIFEAGITDVRDILRGIQSFLHKEVSENREALSPVRVAVNDQNVVSHCGWIKGKYWGDVNT